MKALIDQLIIGTHENIRTTYIYNIYRLAKVETPIILSATRFAGFSTAGWLPGFPAAFFNASPTLFSSSLVPPPLLVVLWIHLLMPGARRPYGEIGGSESTGSAAPV
uniref:Uncharacterized protein n=1 Tax=Ombrophytum subterraneum TaxID=50155 RepID=A0A6M8Q0G0_9MAGN|nr:hypothetical protein [Ombrophytum subterraneum]